ncbi:MAG: hypothetical protein NVSMB62_29200 [Acidobacteriaceae bacterium]
MGATERKMTNVEHSKTPPSSFQAGIRPDANLLVVRICLGYLTFQAALIGFWATLASREWFATFPGLGRHWIGLDGPYNHHLATDVGALFLALAVVTGFAAWSLSRELLRATGLAWVVSAGPHLLYHTTHRAGLMTGDWIASSVGLAIQVALGTLCAVEAGLGGDSG